MPPSSSIDAHAPLRVVSDNRREWIRIDDHLLIEYRLERDQDDRLLPLREPVTEDMIAAAVEKPTAELLARSGDALADAALVPWIRKVDWLIEVILKTLTRSHPGCMDLARVTSVNISGGGIGFVSPQRFDEGDRLALKVILPPFTPIHAIAKVVRATPAPQGEGFALAAEFVEISADDHEQLIRYILQAQAERLRTRRIEEKKA